jgi:hypothetical protein
MGLMTQEKVDRVVRWLTTGHLNAIGGYPFAYQIWRGRVFVAVVTNHTSDIETYDEYDLPDWYDRAEDFLIDNHMCLDWPGDDQLDFGYWGEAFVETMRDIDDEDEDESDVPL